jgi:hypothetical protein
MSSFDNKKLQKSISIKKQNKNQVSSGFKPGAKREIVSPGIANSTDVLQYQRTVGNQVVSEWLNPSQDISSTGIASSEVLSKRGAGKELPSPLRQEMQQHLKMDLSGVRLHTDDAADQLNQQFQSSAFAVGKDIFFRQGFYNPHSENGLKVLKHELAHVAQQGGRSTAQLHLGKVDDRHEQEADKFSSNPHSTMLSHVGNAGVIQRGLFDKLLGHRVQTPAAGPAPVLTPLAGGTANKVYKVNHGPGQKAGYFKPTKDEDPQMASRSVVSSQLDQMLGTQALSKETHAEYNGEVGGESTEVPGKVVSENEFNNKLPPAMAREIDDQTLQDMPQIYKRTAEGTFKTSGTRHMRHDFSHPETQRSMSNIQIQDAIMGQHDRHGGNIKIDDQHTAHGYDNDLVSLDLNNDEQNFDRTGLHSKLPWKRKTRDAARVRALQAVNKQMGKQVGLPSHIDQATARSVLGLKSKDMIAQLKKNKAQGNLSNEQLALLRDRYSAVRRYVKAGMAASGQINDKAKQAKWSSPEYQAMVRTGTGKIPTIVGNGGWGDRTYATQMAEQAQTKGEYPSYLKRSVENLNEASLNRTQIGAYAEPGSFVAAHHAGGGTGAPRMAMGSRHAPPVPARPPVAIPQPQPTTSTATAIPKGNTRKLIEKFGGVV